MQNCHYIILLTYSTYAVTVYNRTTLLASDSSWTRRRLKHLRWRLRRIILCTLERDDCFTRNLTSCVLACPPDWTQPVLRLLIVLVATRSVAAWLPGNSTCLAESSADYQSINASKFPTLVGKFTRQPSRIPHPLNRWRFLIRIAFLCEIFVILFFTDI